MNGRAPDDGELARVSVGWLAYQAGEEPKHEWAVDAMQEWFADEDYSTMARFVMQVCRDVDIDNAHQIGMIGAGPLEDLIEAYQDRALDFVEAEVKTNVALREALAHVWSRGQRSVRERIDTILARYGKEGPEV